MKDPKNRYEGMGMGGMHMGGHPMGGMGGPMDSFDINFGGPMQTSDRVETESAMQYAEKIVKNTKELYKDLDIAINKVNGDEFPLAYKTSIKLMIGLIKDFAERKYTDISRDKAIRMVAAIEFFITDDLENDIIDLKKAKSIVTLALHTFVISAAQDMIATFLVLSKKNRVITAVICQYVREIADYMEWKKSNP